MFHSIDHITSFAIHIGPPLVCYGMRWYSRELEAAWPNTFHINVDVQDPNPMFTMVLLPFVLHVILWSIPYSLVCFVAHKSYIEEKGYMTLYAYYKEGIQSVFKKHFKGLKLTPFIYLSLHATLCTITFFIAQLMWDNFWLNTIYLLFFIICAIWNGSTFYAKVRRK